MVALTGKKITTTAEATCLSDLRPTEWKIIATKDRSVGIYVEKKWIYLLPHAEIGIFQTLKDTKKIVIVQRSQDNCYELLAKITNQEPKKQVA